MPFIHHSRDVLLRLLERRRCWHGNLNIQRERLLR